MTLTYKQYETLRKPLNGTRVAKRTQGGKQLSYLESWDVRAHLIRMFGYGNFDVETLEQGLVGTREYHTDKDMVECIWFAKVQLTIRDAEGSELCRFSESAVGSTSGPATMLGEHHDNAIKTAASDALKRCAINLGSQFGLSLYDNGSTRDVVRGTLVEPPGQPEGVGTPEGAPSEQEAVAALAHSLGATPIEQNGEATS